MGEAKRRKQASQNLREIKDAESLRLYIFRSDEEVSGFLIPFLQETSKEYRCSLSELAKNYVLRIDFVSEIDTQVNYQVDLQSFQTLPQIIQEQLATGLVEQKVNVYSATSNTLAFPVAFIFQHTNAMHSSTVAYIFVPGEPSQFQIMGDVKVTPQTDYFFAQGVDKQNKGDYRGAIADYNEAIRLNPNHVEAYNNRGGVRFKLGDKQGAIKDCNQVITIDTNNDQAYFNRGLIRSVLGDNQAAIEDYNQVIKIDSNNAEAYFNRGLAHSVLGDNQAAIEDYNQAIRINPDHAKAYFSRGTAFYDVANKGNAMKDFKEAIRINPNYAEAYHNRGVARYDLRDDKGAISDLKKAATLYQQGNKQNEYQEVMNNIRQIQQVNIGNYEDIAEILKKFS